MLQALSVPSGLCFRWLEPGQISGYNPPTRTANVGYAESATGYLTVVAHEVCHAYQHQAALDAGFEDDSNIVPNWILTPAGIDFIATTGWSLENGLWIEQGEAGYYGYPHPVEDNAQLCAIWFDPAQYWANSSPSYLENWAPIRYAWAQQWLPALP